MKEAGESRRNILLGSRKHLATIKSYPIFLAGKIFNIAETMEGKIHVLL